MRVTQPAALLRLARSSAVEPLWMDEEQEKTQRGGRGGRSEVSSALEEHRDDLRAILWQATISAVHPTCGDTPQGDPEEQEPKERRT
jgi:hypothetical protein